MFDSQPNGQATVATPPAPSDSFEPGPLHQPRAELARVQRARARRGTRPVESPARTAPVPGHLRLEPRRVLRGPRRRAPGAALRQPRAAGHPPRRDGAADAVDRDFQEGPRLRGPAVRVLAVGDLPAAREPRHPGLRPRRADRAAGRLPRRLLQRPGLPGPDAAGHRPGAPVPAPAQQEPEPDPPDRDDRPGPAPPALRRGPGPLGPEPAGPAPRRGGRPAAVRPAGERDRPPPRRALRRLQGRRVRLVPRHAQQRPDDPGDRGQGQPAVDHPGEPPPAEVGRRRPAGDLRPRRRGLPRATADGPRARPRRPRRLQGGRPDRPDHAGRPLPARGLPRAEGGPVRAADAGPVLQPRQHLRRHPRAGHPRPPPLRVVRLGRAVHRAGGGRPASPGDQADALPDRRRQPDHQRPGPRRRERQARDRAGRAPGAARRGEQHRQGPCPPEGGGPRRLRHGRAEDALQGDPGRAPRPRRRPQALRPPGHRQLQPDHRAVLHRPEPLHVARRVRRGRQRPVQPPDRLFAGARLEQADRRPDQPGRPDHRADRPRTAPRRARPPGADHRQDELAGRPRRDRGPLRRLAAPGSGST